MDGKPYDLEIIRLLEDEVVAERLKEKEDYSNLYIIRCNVGGLQYDINAMMKSFFPSRDVRVLEPNESVHNPAILELPSFMEVEINDEGGFVSVCADINKKYTFSTDEKLGAKNTFKLFFYDVLCDITGRELPWGNLTGIRPTKIAMTMLDNGFSDDEIFDLFKNNHKVSDEKTRLALDIAHREKVLLDQLDKKNGYSIYIGIPFCPTTCLYCSFTSFPIALWQSRLDDYIKALSKEIDFIANEYSQKGPETIYIGGGTPTSLDEEHLEKLLCKLVSTIDMSGCLEFTLEAGRPDSITAKKLEIMKKYGVTRISVNPQTMQQKTLDLIGRRVNVEQVSETFYTARKLGFDDINMDIILGLPGEGTDEVFDTLSKIKDMGTDSLTVHSLAIKRASALKARLDEIGIDTLRNTDETMKMAADAAANMGMKPYYLYRQKNMSGNFENVGYAKPSVIDENGNILVRGSEGIYNILIMEEVQTIIACGAGSISKKVTYRDGCISDISRCENHKDVALYIEKIDELIDRKRSLFLF